MKTALSIVSVILGLIIVIGLSIWVGFPSPEGFDRLTIVFVGYLIGCSVLLAGLIGLFIIYDVF